jgi:MFS family permease
VLAIVVAAQFIYVVDAFVVNVAIPSIKADLAATSGEIQGVIVCYLIAFAALVVTGGRLGDIHGAKPVFLCVYWALPLRRCGAAWHIPVPNWFWRAPCRAPRPRS